MMNQDLFRNIFVSTSNISPITIVINLTVALLLGLVIAFFYRRTHKGLSYSQSFILTIVFLTIITTAVIMTIGNSIARAFALVGALSIIRFRTVVKDTKDTAIVFLALCIGLATGTSNYFLAIFTVFFMCLIMWILFKVNFGALKETEFILRFYYDRDSDDNKYLDLLYSETKYLNLLHMEPTGDGEKIHLTYDVSLKERKKAKDLIAKLTKIEGISEIVLVSSKSDVDY